MLQIATKFKNPYFSGFLKSCFFYGFLLYSEFTQGLLLIDGWRFIRRQKTDAKGSMNDVILSKAVLITGL